MHQGTPCARILLVAGGPPGMAHQTECAVSTPRLSALLPFFLQFFFFFKEKFRTALLTHWRSRLALSLYGELVCHSRWITGDEVNTNNAIPG